MSANNGGAGGGSYGTFEGPPSYPPPRPPPHHRAAAYHYHRTAATAAADYDEAGRVCHDRLPCCGIGYGWFLFIIGFFLGAIPWYVGAFLLCCSSSRVDYRDKPGYVACTAAAGLATIAVIIGATAGAHVY